MPYLISNGYSGYRSFVSTIFDDKTTTFGGPDFRGGSEVYTIAFTVVAPSLETFSNFINSIDRITKISSDLFNTIAQDTRSGFEKLTQNIVKNDQYPLEGLIKGQNSGIVTLNGDIITVNSFDYLVQDFQQSKRNSQLKTFTLKETTLDNDEKVYQIFGSKVFLKPGTSYVVYLDAKNSGQDNVFFEILEKKDENEKKIDVLSSIYPAPSEPKASLVFNSKLVQLKNSRKIPLAIFTTKCSVKQKYYLDSIGPIKANSVHTLVPLENFGVASTQQSSAGQLSGDLLYWQRLLSTAGLNIDGSAIQPQNSQNPWFNASLSTLNGVAPLVAYLRQVKSITKGSNLSQNKGIVKQLLDIIDALVKYIKMISDFIRQLSIISNMIKEFIQAIQSLSSLNIYGLMVIPGMSALSSTEDLKNLYISARGLPTGEDLYFASLISVFAIPTGDSLVEKMRISYGLPEGQPLPSYLTEKTKLISQDSPGSTESITALLNLIKQFGLIK